MLLHLNISTLGQAYQTPSLSTNAFLRIQHQPADSDFALFKDEPSVCSLGCFSSTITQPLHHAVFLSVSVSATAAPEVAVAAVAKHVSSLFYFFLCKEQRVVGVRHQPLTLCHLIQTH